MPTSEEQALAVLAGEPFWWEGDTVRRANGSASVRLTLRGSATVVEVLVRRLRQHARGVGHVRWLSRPRAETEACIAQVILTFPAGWLQARAQGEDFPLSRWLRQALGGPSHQAVRL